MGYSWRMDKALSLQEKLTKIPFQFDLKKKIFGEQFAELSFKNQHTFSKLFERIYEVYTFAASGQVKGIIIQAISTTTNMWI